jgi:hypothetical protein
MVGVLYYSKVVTKRAKIVSAILNLIGDLEKWTGGRPFRNSFIADLPG